MYGTQIQEARIMITNFVVFAFVVGLLTGAVVVGAIHWAKDLGLNMGWWKWLLSALWYLLLLFLLFAAFTFIGEGESAAGWKTVGISAVLMVILGVGLLRILKAK
jgi:hypothetical protein